MPTDAVLVAGVCKRFRVPSLPKQATLKDIVVRRIRAEGRHGVVDALDGVTFSVARGQTLGIIGRNGSGKTTLMRILAGIVKADRGEIRLRGTVAPLLALGTGFNPMLTGRENAFIELLMLGMTRSQARGAIDDVIEFSELAEFIDAPMRAYSAGMTMRLAFAAAIRVDPEILLIDEVLAVGDEHFARKCTKWLEDFKRRGKTTILVSHSASSIAAQCDVALWLDNGCVLAFGDTLGVLSAYHEGESGKPVAAALAPQPIDRVESAMAVADGHRALIAGSRPMQQLPLVGSVQLRRRPIGGYVDGWTSGTLEFTIEPQRDVASWTVRATVPSALPEGSSISVEVDGTLVATVAAMPGSVVVHCERRLEKAKAARVRIVSSDTVNFHALGVSDDVRDLGLRLDEIEFDHE
jgi:lipopolysaccharide transport system ATP-binding protein